MQKVTKDEMDYFLSKINFGASFLDAKAIDIMNRISTLFADEAQVEKVDESTQMLEKKFGKAKAQELSAMCVGTIIDIDALEDFVKYRNEIKKPLKTIRPLKQYAKELIEIDKAGFTVLKAIEIMKSSEWQTINLDWIKKKMNTTKSGADLAQFGFGADSTQGLLK